MRDLAAICKLVLTEKKDILYSILFGFIAGIAAIGMFAASGYLISKAFLLTPLYALIIVTSFVKLLGFTRAFSRFGERYVSHRATFTILGNLRATFFEKLEPLAPSIFTKYRSGDLLARVVSDVESLQNFFLRVLYPPIVLLIVFLSTVVFTMFFSAYIAWILLAGMLLTVFVIPTIFAFRQSKIDPMVRQKRSELSTELNEFFQGFRDLKIHSKLQEKEQAVLGISESYIEEQERESINKTYNLSLNTFVTLLFSWIIVAVGAYLVTVGDLEGVFLAMLIMISLTVFEDVSPMAVFPAYLQESKQSATRLFSIFRKEERPEEHVHEKYQVQDGPLSIEMDQVSFSFQQKHETTTLSKINLQIKAGEKIAIVGPSGSGKSTLLQLILNLYQPNEGQVRINGLPLHEVDEQSLWQQTNVMLQENQFFFGTIRDNLKLAGDHLSDQSLIQALEKVNLNHFTLDDAIFEKGDNLSGGEKQRLAIARAMLKGGCLWLLDEPTSSLDAVMEHSILSSLYEQAHEATVVLVSHRLKGLEQMDQIIQMSEGAIVESGTFAELMSKKGYFYEMKQLEKEML